MRSVGLKWLENHIARAYSDEWCFEICWSHKKQSREIFKGIADAEIVQCFVKSVSLWIWCFKLEEYDWKARKVVIEGEQFEKFMVSEYLQMTFSSRQRRQSTLLWWETVNKAAIYVGWTGKLFLLLRLRCVADDEERELSLVHKVEKMTL